MEILTVFNKNDNSLGGMDDALRIVERGEDPAVIINLVTFEGIKKVIYGSVIAIALISGQVRAQSSEVISGDFRHVPFVFSAFVEKLVELEEQRVSNGIKFFPAIASLGENVTSPNTQTEGSNSPASSPDQSNQPRVSVENQNKLTPEAAEHLEGLLWLMLFQFLVLFPLGIYFSMCVSPRILAKRKRWMKLYELKAKRFYRNNPDPHADYPMPRKTFCQWLWF